MINEINCAYGVDSSLVRILEELGVYCALAGKPNSEIKLILPREVLDQFTQSLKPKERIQMAEFGNPTNDSSVTLLVTSAKIKLFSDDQAEISLK